MYVKVKCTGYQERGTLSNFEGELRCKFNFVFGFCSLLIFCLFVYFYKSSTEDLGVGWDLLSTKKYHLVKAIIQFYNSYFMTNIVIVDS